MANPAELTRSGRRWSGLVLGGLHQGSTQREVKQEGEPNQRSSLRLGYPASSAPHRRDEPPPSTLCGASLCGLGTVTV
jgi:hypothetical protein